MRVLPPTASRDAAVLLTTRGIRAFLDGLVSVVLPSYLVLLGLSSVEVGAVATTTMLGSAALTLLVGTRGHGIPRRLLLQLAAVLMVATGLGFASIEALVPLLVVAFVGTINPSGGDVSVFLPAEQALLPSTVSDGERTALFGRYSVVALTAAAVGSLAAGVPQAVAAKGWLAEVSAERLVFVVYAGAGAAILLLYRRLAVASDLADGVRSAPLGPSRAHVYRLAAVFSLDAFGGGFVVNSMIALWLFERFDLSLATAGAIFFWTQLLSGVSALVSVRIARSIGLVRTMSYTHLPANALLVAAAFMPNVGLAVACLLARSLLSQMDVPVRTSFVMASVTPAERPAAASVTNVPRSLAAAVGPFAAGWLLGRSTFGWPLVIGGVLKGVYDIVLLAMFRDVEVPEERPHRQGTARDP